MSLLKPTWENMNNENQTQNYKHLGGLGLLDKKAGAKARRDPEINR